MNSDISAKDWICLQFVELNDPFCVRVDIESWFHFVCQHCCCHLQIVQGWCHSAGHWTRQWPPTHKPCINLEDADIMFRGICCLFFFPFSSDLLCVCVFSMTGNPINWFPGFPGCRQEHNTTLPRLKHYAPVFTTLKRHRGQINTLKQTQLFQLNSLSV